MRPGFLLALLLFIMPCQDVRAQNADVPPILFSAVSKRELGLWAAARYGFFTTKEFKLEDKEVFILTGQAGFGASRKVVYVYLCEQGVFSLLAMRETNSSRIDLEIDPDKNAIVAKSKSGQILMILPLPSLNLNYDAQEQ